MASLLSGLAILLGGGVVAAILGRASRGANVVGVASAVAGCVLAWVPALRVLATGESLSGALPWHVPDGSLSIELSPLSAWFALPVLALSALSALYAIGYLAEYRHRRSLGALWLFYNLLTIGMVLVLVARNGVLFLVAWEVMSLASFFLVTFDHEKSSVREAGRVYLIATHLGTACLLAMFILLGREAGSLDFAAIATATELPPELTTVVFLLAVVGFGTKAGFVPFHVWLPDAHPAAPSHVSAVMSGVMIKTGIYGLVAVSGFLPLSAWHGWLLISIGALSGVFGVLFALAQHDLKRLLAYHSVENIGIIAIGLGVGILGLTGGRPEIAVLGFAGGLLHVLNHAVFKGLLFLGAGCVIHGTGTAEIDELGGLRRAMPMTCVTFLVGSVAICGLPPLNGFVSEFLIYFGAFRGQGGLAATGVPALAAIGSLALIGGLALACFTKAFGVVFLGTPRTQRAVDARPPSASMAVPMAVLAAVCLGIGLGAPWVLETMTPMLAAVTGLPAAQLTAPLTASSAHVSAVALMGVILLGLIVALVLVRRWLLSGRAAATTGTWDCGYARPTARMQYTASSFAQPFTAFFGALLRTSSRVEGPKGLFPRDASFESHTGDAAMNGVFRPVFAGIAQFVSKLQWVQNGRVNSYVMYIAITIVVLFSWFAFEWSER